MRLHFSRQFVIASLEDVQEFLGMDMNWSTYNDGVSAWVKDIDKAGYRVVMKNEPVSLECEIKKTPEGWNYSESYNKDTNIITEKWVKSIIPYLQPLCTHEWKHYTGLTEVYHYCILCDKKKEENV